MPDLTRELSHSERAANSPFMVYPTSIRMEVWIEINTYTCLKVTPGLYKRPSIASSNEHKFQMIRLISKYPKYGGILTYLWCYCATEFWCRYLTPDRDCLRERSFLFFLGGIILPMMAMC